MYDYLIVGAGLFGAVFACEASKKGKKCLVIDKRNHIGGNIYTDIVEGITVHKYGAHIFHTSNEHVWKYINQFTNFNRYTNCPIANYKEELYNLPFNMNTFYALWGVRTPSEAKEIIDQQRLNLNGINPKNLEEQAIQLVGIDIYQKLIKGYTEKQWGRRAVDLPASIIKRIPLRFTFDNNYFNDKYQGIPEKDYTCIISEMIKNADVRLNYDYFENIDEMKKKSKKIVFTGKIDEFFDYQFGKLEYRSLKFESELLDVENFQGNAVINYTDFDVPYTRIIEHKHFKFTNSEKTYITREYPSDAYDGCEPFYPVNDTTNEALYKKYEELSKMDKNIIFGGRLANYKYYDMDDTVEAALACIKIELEGC